MLFLAEVDEADMLELISVWTHLVDTGAEDASIDLIEKILDQVLDHATLMGGTP